MNTLSLNAETDATRFAIRPGPDEYEEEETDHTERWQIIRTADEICREPILLGWFLAAAGQPAEGRRRLLTQMAEEIRAEVPEPAIERVLRQMEEPDFQEAVLEELYAQGGFDPNCEGAKRGRMARRKLAALGEQLEVLGLVPVAG